MVHATDKMRVAQEKLTQTTAEALEVQTRPNVIISIELHSFLGYLVVQNAGVGEAFDVRVECVGSLQSFPDQLLTEARFLADGFTYLAPSQKHAALFFNTTRPFPPDPRLHLAVRYRSRAGAPYVAEFPLDVGELKGVALQYSATERGLEKLVEIHEELKKK